MKVILGCNVILGSVRKSKTTPPSPHKITIPTVFNNNQSERRVKRNRQYGRIWTCTCLWFRPRSQARARGPHSLKAGCKWDPVRAIEPTSQLSPFAFNDWTGTRNRVGPDGTFLALCISWLLMNWYLQEYQRYLSHLSKALVREHWDTSWWNYSQVS